VTDEGYPALTCGTTDKQRHFHPYGLGFAFNETEDDFAFIFDAIKHQAKGRIKQRLTAIQFLNAMIDVIENWSLDRAPIVQGIANPNLRIYESKPEISKADWQSAFIP
jgi:hypothetical protein